MAKNRYVVLTDHYLDWYTKPVCILSFVPDNKGDKRLGCILLDSIYVRIHSDQTSLVIGNTMKNGKEFRLTTEGGDVNGSIGPLCALIS